MPSPQTWTPIKQFTDIRYERTPDGIRRTESESTAQVTTVGATGEAASIAVLPFADMSPEQDQEYFADGISEELLNSLARIRDLRVSGRTSSFYFKGRNEDLRKVGITLNLRYSTPETAFKLMDEQQFGMFSVSWGGGGPGQGDVLDA